MNRINRLKSLGGFTLTSLMIGSLITVVSLMAGVGFYKQHVKTSVLLMHATSHNSRIHFLLNALEIEISLAGYGLLNTTPGTAQSISVKKNESTNELYWKYKEDDILKCRGLREFHFNDVEQDEFRIEMHFIEASAESCTYNLSLIHI